MTDAEHREASRKGLLPRGLRAVIAVRREGRMRLLFASRDAARAFMREFRGEARIVGWEAR